MMIRSLDKTNIPTALSLVKRIFDEFEAPDYSKEGIATFYDFINPVSISEKLQTDNLKCWGAFEDDKVLGVIATRNINHIALFFVDKDYHRQGIGRKLYQMVVEDVKQNGLDYITVNSSPYAVPVYHKLGFGYTDVEQLTDGLRYTPMKAFLHGKTLKVITNDERAALFPVILAPHSPKWEGAFEAERAMIQNMSCAKDITGIHHYGSTAIPGIYAKPCVDILLEILEKADLNGLISSFENAGYGYIRYDADLPPHIMFMKGYTDIGFVGQTFHIHVRYPGEHDELLFRDYLLAHPEKAKEYEALKLRLKKAYEYDRDGYTMAKGEFIRSVTEEARKR